MLIFSGSDRIRADGSWLPLQEQLWRTLYGKHFQVGISSAFRLSVGSIAQTCLYANGKKSSGSTQKSIHLQAAFSLLWLSSHASKNAQALPKLSNMHCNIVHLLPHNPVANLRDNDYIHDPSLL